MLGLPVPAFSLTGADGKSISDQDYVGKPLVVFLPPSQYREPCTREAEAFTALMPEFAQAAAAVLAVSDDPPAALRKFRDKRALTVTPRLR